MLSSLEKLDPMLPVELELPSLARPVEALPCATRDLAIRPVMKQRGRSFWNMAHVRCDGCLSKPTWRASYRALSLVICCIILISLVVAVEGRGRGGHSRAKSFNGKRRGHRDPHYVYTLNLENGRKYVGRTQDLNQRLGRHFDGRGAQWTQRYRPVSVADIRKFSSKQAASRAETQIYYQNRDIHGPAFVRGAGHTRSKENDRR
jgi:predicted GIY-YIG superfamily endonuclease